MVTNGYKNKFAFVNILNNKYVFELDNNMKNLLKKLFSYINEKDRISC